MGKYQTAICMCMVLGTIMGGCDDSRTHTNEPADDAATTSSNISTSAFGQQTSLDGIWLDVAAKHDISPAVMEMTNRLVADLIAWRTPVDVDIKLADFQRSLGRYLDQYKPWLDDQRSSEGAAYWTAYCIVRSLERSSSSTDREALREYYLALLDQAATILETGIRSNLSDELQRKMDSLIREGMQYFRHECGLRLANYIIDPLCPAFHARLSEKDENGFLECYRNTSNLPVPEDLSMRTQATWFVWSPRKMVTAEDAFHNQFKNYIENEIGLLLFDLFIRSLDTPLNKTEYWGYMNYRASTVDGILRATDTWPAAIRFVPDPIYNEAHGWTRKQFGSPND